MAIDNLDFLVQWAPAGQQMDKFSENPWMIVSKNADIFSSSRSVKATAFSVPDQLSSGIVDIDETGRFELHTNGKVWDTKLSQYVTNEYMNLGAVNRINYWNGISWAPTMWTPLKLFVEWNDDNSNYKTLTVVTDRLIYVKEYDLRSYSPIIKNLKNCTLESDWGIKWDGSHNYLQFDIDFDVPGFCYSWQDLYLRKEEYQYGEHLWDATIDYVRAYHPNLIYDANNDRIVTQSVTNRNVSTSGDQPIFDTDPSNRWYTSSNRVWIMNYYVYPEWVSQNGALRVRINLTKEDDTYFNGKIYIDHQDEFRWYTTFIPYQRNRIAKKSGEYFVIWSTKMTGLYQFVPVYDVEDGETVTYSTLLKYDFKEQIELPAYHWLEVVDVVVTDSIIYRFWNNRGVGYISIFPLIAGDEWEHQTYPGIEFIWAIRLNNIIYIIANNRGVSTLYAYNGAELVPIICGSIKNWESDLIEYREQFRFNKINEWRWNIVLWSSDNKIFMYGPTAGGKAMSQIHQLSEWNITDILPVNDTLKIMYKISSNQYQTILQDNQSIKNYNTEWAVAYPIKIWNHLLEKEESDLQVSYILPSSDCKIELRWLANLYHFWTFTSSENVTLTKWESYKMKWCTGDYQLKFIEKNGDQYTFELVGALPIQITNVKKITDTSGDVLFTYTDFNHFRKIGEINSNWYDEGYFRFHNINNLFNFPKTHSLQVMVKWSWTSQYTPEVFTINLTASQRNRW